MAFPVLLPRASACAAALSARCTQSPADRFLAEPFDEAEAVPEGTHGWMRVPISGPTSDPFSDPFSSTLKNGHFDPANAQVRAESHASSRPDLIYSTGLFRSTRLPGAGISASCLIVARPVRFVAFPRLLAGIASVAPRSACRPGSAPCCYRAGMTGRLVTARHASCATSRAQPHVTRSARARRARDHASGVPVRNVAQSYRPVTRARSRGGRAGRRRFCSRPRKIVLKSVVASQCDDVFRGTIMSGLLYALGIYFECARRKAGSRKREPGTNPVVNR
jgi:hypothetical protein